uniref:Protein FAM177A1-like n=1 Tax=Phallusia mammillata TaxID=59560 RepID=A0A6F9DBT8_9ASCI|nr:protein FAM177A1-like [Phallusia mammillata]
MANMTSEEPASFQNVPIDTAILCPESLEHFKIDKHGKVKVPRRLIHCSDGILEEYSTDEEEEEPPPPPVDVSKLTWPSYLWYQTLQTAFGGLAVCDYLGEKLAYIFGITSPKYQYAIDEIQRMEDEEQEDADLEAEERSAEDEFVRKVTGATTATVDDVTVKDPKSNIQ